MAPSTHLFLLLTISMVFISHAAILPTSSPKLYEEVCKKPHSQDFEQRCLTILRAYPEITLAKDYITFSRLFINVLLKKAKNAQNDIKILMNKYPSSKAIKECATTHYNMLTVELKVSLGELDSSPSTASLSIMYAGDGPKLCEIALADEKIVNTSISSLNNEMLFLLDIASIATGHF